MNDDVQNILKEYIKCVNDVCIFLMKEINIAENLELKNKYDFFDYRAKCKRMKFQFDGICYRLHGKGCTAYNDRMFLDWDFGYRSRWCGINPWKVAMTLKKSNSPHNDYYNGEFIKNACEEMVHSGILYKKYEQYYFEMNMDDTFTPNFPDEYDTLIIEYGDLKWKISRNKLIDRFIRKSVKVKNQIVSDQDKYMLKFYLAEKIVYSITYDELSYPESAVEIMSDNIIKNL